MTEQALESLLSRFPTGRIRIFRIENDEIQKISFYNCIGNRPSLDHFFKPLYEAGALNKIKAMEFLCDGDDYERTSTINPQEVIDLLARYGPFEKLEELSVSGEDYIAAHAIRDFSALNEATPFLRHLDLSCTRGVKLESRLELESLRHLILADFSFHQLEKLGDCYLPGLEVLELSFSEQEARLKLQKKSLEVFCQGSFSRNLKTIVFTASNLSGEQARQWVDHFIDAFPDSKLLQGLTFLELSGFQFSIAQLERLSQKKQNFVHLEKLYLGGNLETWPEMKKRVGDFVNTPLMVREQELANLNNFPEDASEMRTQIGKIVHRIKIEDAPKMDECQFVAGVITEQLEAKKMKSWVAVFDRKALKVVDTAQAMGESNLEVPGELTFYQQIPSILDALGKLQTPVHLLVCEGAIEQTPHEFSLAGYLGVKLDIPTLGCADAVSFGKFELPKDEAQEATFVMSGGRDSNHCIALCLRTQMGAAPVFVSAGHKISIRTAGNLILELSRENRRPEPLCAAHECAGKDL